MRNILSEELIKKGEKAMINYRQYSTENLKTMLYNAKREMYKVEGSAERQEFLEMIDTIEDELFTRGIKPADISMIGEIRISVGYINVMDKSIIFKTFFDENGKMSSEELVGWYFGRPNEKDTKVFCNGNMTATFLD